MYHAQAEFNVNRFRATFRRNDNIDVTNLSEHISSPYTFYEGEITVTPSANQTVLPTEGKILRNNIIVNPIPSNYGLVAWNGSFLSIT